MVTCWYCGFIGYGLLGVYFIVNIFWVCDDVSILIQDAIKWLGSVVFDDFLVDFFWTFVI